MTTAELDPQAFNQELIYDDRYRGGYNGMGSPVTVMTSERLAMADAVRRLQLGAVEGISCTLLDHGYGVGRVPNELLATWPGPGDLTVVANDVSLVGLERGMKVVHHFLPNIRLYDSMGRIIGECSSDDREKVKRTIRFVHTRPEHTTEQVADILYEANGGQEFDITTSWYDAVSHTRGRQEREGVFEMLGRLTQPLGEIVITASTIGDFNSEFGEEEFERFPSDDEDVDVVYKTEIGVKNYVHLFGKGFEHHMRATLTAPGQKLWVAGIRPLGEEYKTGEEELVAFAGLQRINRAMRGIAWTQDDYRAIHTVGGFRSPRPPEGQKLL